jgi:hypothetical protein
MREPNLETAPAAYYERAVGIWKESKDPTPEELKEMRISLEKAANYGSFELDARLGIRVTTALDTIAIYGEWQKQQRASPSEKE